MRTTVNLGPEVYRLALALAAQRKISVGQVLGDALLSQFKPNNPTGSRFAIDEDSFPTIYANRVITPKEVATAIEEE